MRVWKGAEPEVALTLKRDLYVTGQRGRMGSVKAEFELPEHLIAPLSAQTALGKARIVVEGSTIAAHDLYAAQDVAARRDLPARNRHREALVRLRWPSRFQPAT